MHTFSNYSLQSFFVSALFFMDWILHEKNAGTNAKKLFKQGLRRSNIGTESTRMFFIGYAMLLFCCNLICSDDLILFNMFMRETEKRQTCRLRFLKYIAYQNKITYLKMKNCRFMRDERE